MGEFLALVTALFFAVGVILFKKSVAVVPPFALNLFKNCMALLLLAVTTVVLGHARVPSVPTADLLTILLSGAIGIGVSDTLFFMTLSRLGASRTALIDCLYSPFVILFSMIAFRETLPVMAAGGGALILASVIVSSRQTQGEGITRRQFWIGCALGAGAMATVAVAIVMVKPLLNTYPLSWLTTLRMIGGLIVLILSWPFHPDRRSAFRIFRPQRTWKWIGLATFFGSYLSLVSWLAGFKYSQAGTVALLNQTSTVWIVLFATLFLKEPMTRLKGLAVAMAFAGAVLVVS